MLTSTRSAPMPSTICAAAAIFSGSPPKIWTDTGRSSSVYSAYSSVRSIPRTKPSALTISVTTRPQPPWRLTRRRNAVSVIPAMGATANGDGSSTEPIRIRFSGRESVGPDVGSVDFHRYSLPDQIHRQHETGTGRVLPQQPSDDTPQWTVDDFHHDAFPDEWARIVLKLGAHEQSDAVQLDV